MAVRLSLSTLSELSVPVPGYDRGELKPGIVHFGPGNFHRAHQAVYLDRLFSQGEGHDWALVGASVMPGDAKAREILLAQDCLTSVVEQAAGKDAQVSVTGPMIDYLPVADADAIGTALADPATRIVSLTITEGGYFLDPDGNFVADHPAIAADAANPDAPKTVFGMIVAALRARRDAGTPAFTVMSCDNIPHNGVVTRNAVVGLAKLSDPDFAAWIEREVAFPNGMVDRITPATSDRERRIIREEFAIEDDWPVFCEDFMQWVLEDNFPLGRPALDKVGVQFVPDVTPYELMKIRILNGGHAIIAYPAGLLGIEFVHEAMENPLVSGFLRKVEQEEVIPGVPPVPDTDIGAYFAKIEERFSNPAIGDTVRRLCLDGSNRQPKFIVPPIRDALERGGSVEGLALESALWCRYCAGTTDAGAEIAPNDPQWERLVPLAKDAKETPRAWLDGLPDVYGPLAGDERFAPKFAAALEALWRDGTEAVLKRYLETGSAAS